MRAIAALLIVTVLTGCTTAGKPQPEPPCPTKSIIGGASFGPVGTPPDEKPDERCPE